MNHQNIQKKSATELLNSFLREINLQVTKAKETQDLQHMANMETLRRKLVKIMEEIVPPKG